MFGWNQLLVRGSGEEKFYILSMYFGYFAVISPSKRAGSFIWANLNSLTKGCFVPSLVEIGAELSGEEFIKKFSMYFRYFVIICRREGPSFEQIKLPLPKFVLCHVWLKLAEWFWRRRCKCEKFTTTKTDNKQISVRKAHLGLRLRWA